MTCKVSVIVPVYNIENYLSECLESIINQSLKDIEIICINDGSKDSSKNILEKFQTLDSRIMVLNKSNAGYGCACNYGLKIAKGEYCSIIESDDYIDPKMLEDLYEIAKSNNSDIVKSSYYEVINGKNYSDRQIKKINWNEIYKMPETTFSINEAPQFLYFHPSIWSCIYKTSFLRENNIYFEEPKGAGWADNPFQVKTLCCAKKISYTDKAYYFYRIANPNSSSVVVNINNPFDRSCEIHKFLDETNFRNENSLAHLYKREFSYIDIVLSCISTDMIDYTHSRILELLNKMNKSIVFNNKYITDYEKQTYNSCQTKKGLIEKMQQVKKHSTSVASKAVIN